MEEFKWDFDESVTPKIGRKKKESGSFNWDREPTNEEILESGNFTLNWVGKHRTCKSKLEEEEKFRQRFLQGKLQVRKCTVFSPRGYIERISDQDIKYMPR
jgi:hypothetical protein